MSAFEIALSVAIGLASFALQSSVDTRRFEWRDLPAHGAQGAMVGVLVAGVWWSSDVNLAGVLLIGWGIGFLAGPLPGAIRSRKARRAGSGQAG